MAFGQALKVTLLGTGNPRPSIERFGPSILVEAGKETLLFDCGRGATIRLAQAKVPFSSVTALFLTHLHSDHVVGIPDLWLSGWIMGRQAPLQVWGPAGTTDMLKHLEEAYAFDVHVRRDVDEQLSAQGAVLTGKDIDEGVVYENDGVKVTAFRVDHGLVKPALGYRIDYQGHSVVLSGDTRPSDNLVKFAQGTDLLVHEVFDPEAYREISNSMTPEQRKRVAEHHTTPEEAGRIFARVAPKLAVYSHIVPPDVPDVVPHTSQDLFWSVGSRRRFDDHRDWRAGSRTASGTLRASRDSLGPRINYRRLSASNSSSVRGQSEPNKRDRLRSASTLPPVWQRAQ